MSEKGECENLLMSSVACRFRQKYRNALNNRAIIYISRPRVHPEESFKRTSRSALCKAAYGREITSEIGVIVVRGGCAEFTKHKRNYYYARYSYIPFKAFGRTARATASGDYYPIELVRSKARARCRTMRVVLRHPLSANRRNTARQETLSSYRTS